MDLASIMICVAAYSGVPAPATLPSVETVTQERLDRMPGGRGRWGKYFAYGRQIFIVDPIPRKVAHEFAHDLSLGEDAAKEVESHCG